MKTISTVNKVLPILVLGDTGKSGRRIASRILDKNLPLRRGSRSSTPAFHWEHPEEWSRLLSGVGSIYVTYPQDLPIEHVSYYEADAFARWKGVRLPTEQEWEHG